MLRTTIAGSLPKPAWLARPEMLWAPWALPPDTLAAGQRDAVLIALKDPLRHRTSNVQALCGIGHRDYDQTS